MVCFVLRSYEGDDFHGFASYQNYSAYLDDTRVYDGKRSLRLATNTVWGGPIYGIRVNAGDIVSFEGYTYFEGGPGTTGGEFICKVVDEVSTNEVNVWTKDFSSHNTIAGSWQKAYINNYVVPAVGGSNRVLYMTIKPLTYAYQQATWFDNLKVVIKSPTRTETVAVADIITLTDYYAFGMAMPGRTLCNSEQYRYGFNGMEKDDDWYGAGNEYTTEFRQLDVRTGRWMSMDPMMAVVPDRTPYEFVFNNPVALVDPSGLLPSGKGGGDPNKNQKGPGQHGQSKDPPKGKGSGDKGTEKGENDSGGGKSSGGGVATVAENLTEFVKDFSSSLVFQAIKVVAYAANNPNHAGYGYPAAPPSRETIDMYAFNWRQAFDPSYQIQSFSELAVGSIFDLGYGLYFLDGKMVGEALPKVVLTYSGVARPIASMLRTPMQRRIMMVNAARGGTKAFSGTEKAWSSGATPNSIYTYLSSDGKAVSNYIYNAEGKVIYQVDFGKHGKFLSGHGHEMSVPGNLGSGHTNHIPWNQVPSEYLEVPKGVQYSVTPGQ